ncbi:MAG TPA: methyltransferase domain-containing protein [Rugosimonospora sp.]
MTSGNDSSPVFGDLDRQSSQRQAMVVDVLDRLAGAPIIRAAREVARDALALGPGQRVLDAGAGTGEVARDLATLVGPDGEVVAMDSSAAVVDVASRRHDGSPVRYVVGDITAMGFPDASFDAVRSERVLQHLAEPDAAVSELLRVLRPGGRVALIDTDWQSFLTDGIPRDLLDDLERRAEAAGLLRHGRSSSGRLLRGRLIRAGARDVVARPITMALNDIPSTGVIHPAFNFAALRAVGFLPEEVIAPWVDAVESAVARDEFLAVITIWVATGTRPGA